MSTEVPSYPSLKPDQLGYCIQALEFFKAKRADQPLIAKEFKYFKDHPHGSDVESEVNGGCLVAKLDVNYAKNRHENVLAFDGSRVVIDPCNDPSSMGYINASFVTSEVNPSESVSRFIAAQGPLPDTFHDFWEMILQNHCPAIVMLTKLVEDNGELKCDEYYQAEDGPRLFGNIRTVTRNIPSTDSLLVLCEMLVTREESEDPPLPVWHIRYLEWPDRGVPSNTSAVREIFKRIWNIPSSKGPIVVHCSAGVGRTGTYCGVHNTIQRILVGDLSALDLEKTIRGFRFQRMGMVKNLDQYVFCHDAIIDILDDLISDSARMMFSVGTGTATSVIELIEISLSDHKWREIDDSFDTRRTSLRSSDISGSVCVNSVMCRLLLWSFEILAFDLRTDAFSVVKVPLDDLHYDLSKRYGGNDLYFIQVNGCVGVVCSHRMVKVNEMHIWILKDFENHVWVKETITIPESWDASDCPMPLDCTNTGEFIFSVRKLSQNVISVPIYNMKSRCFRSVQFTLDHPLLRSQHVHFYQIKCHVESLMPL
ncbi:protein-tyrosine-phosphatase PTP1-like [Bidens hawaiensis]|uniref:protein-tyrosine-phosphatase PTP1-like n=1 Tax=Bidens hawaiensis TaxID=980011 RepID=UPI00404A9F25